MLRSSFSAAPTLIHPFTSFPPGSFFALAKPSDQPNSAAQLLAARLKRRLRLKEITMPQSMLAPCIAGWLLRPCNDGGKDENTDAKYAEKFFCNETLKRQKMAPIDPWGILIKPRAPVKLRDPLYFLYGSLALPI
jgi:hypothetical protein